MDASEEMLAEEDAEFDDRLETAVWRLAKSGLLVLDRWSAVWLLRRAGMSMREIGTAIWMSQVRDFVIAAPPPVGFVTLRVEETS